MATACPIGLAGQEATQPHLPEQDRLYCGYSPTATVGRQSKPVRGSRSAANDGDRA
jgi:hypothetical protein